MKFYATLEETLAKRFDDNDEVESIVNNGIIGGFNGFIYTYEINEFFNEFENEIENYFYEMFGDDWMKEITSFKSFSSMDEMKAFMVWSVAEDFCNRKYDLMAEAAA